MNPVRCSVETDVLFVVDLQDPFCDHLDRSEALLRRSAFIIRVAAALGVPIIATEQVPERLGPTHPALLRYLPDPIPKYTFSSLADSEVRTRWDVLQRPNAIVIGAETHICVSATSLDLLEIGAHVIVCPDALSSRTIEAHKLGMERLRDSGVIPAHTESVVYEWLKTSKNPGFKEVLKLVKEFAL
jgi:nicotinamidase-related amidase